jgi:hypothetical protein
VDDGEDHDVIIRTNLIDDAIGIGGYLADPVVV